MSQNIRGPRRIFGSRWASSAATMMAVLLLAGLLAACHIERRSYITTFDQPGLSKLLKDQSKVCIVSFTVQPPLYTPGGDELNVNPGMLPVTLVDKEANRTKAAEITTALAGAHFEKTVAGLSERFLLVGPVAYDEVKGTLSQTQQIREAIAQSGADFGLTVSDQFGWKWAAENTGVESYYFKTCAVVYDTEGQSIWKFCNKGSINPRLPGIGSFIAGVAGAAAPVEEIVSDFDRYFSDYPALLVLLMDEDAAGKTHQAWYDDYFPADKNLGKKINRPFITNENDERYLPDFP